MVIRRDFIKTTALGRTSSAITTASAASRAGSKIFPVTRALFIRADKNGYHARFAIDKIYSSL